MVIGSASTSAVVKVVPSDGHDHHVDLLPHPGHLDLELAQSMHRGEHVDSRVRFAAAEDLPDHRKDGVGVVGDEIAELGKPFGDPRSLVQQVAGISERPPRGLGHPESIGDPGPSGQVRQTHRCVVEEFQVVDRREADP